jgi:hypothetical protein
MELMRSSRYLKITSVRRQFLALKNHGLDVHTGVKQISAPRDVAAMTA